MTRTLTSKAVAYLTNDYGVKLQDLPTLKDASALHFYNAPADCIPDTWTRVGEATITVEFDDPTEAANSRVAVLRQLLQTHQADAQMRDNAIQAEIQNLLALPCEVEA